MQLVLWVQDIQTCLSSAIYRQGRIDAMSAVQVYSIREAATSNLAKLAREFGPDWARDHLVPQVNLAAD